MARKEDGSAKCWNVALARDVWVSLAVLWAGLLIPALIVKQNVTLEEGCVHVPPVAVAGYHLVDQINVSAYWIFYAGDWCNQIVGEGQWLFPCPEIMSLTVNWRWLMNWMVRFEIWFRSWLVGISHRRNLRKIKRYIPLREDKPKLFDWDAWREEA